MIETKAKPFSFETSTVHAGSGKKISMDLMPHQFIRPQLLYLRMLMKDQKRLLMKREELLIFIQDWEIQRLSI